ncbi:vesicle transport protein GOT1-like [Wolffia australiana]
MEEKKKVGIGLLGCGAFFAFLGVLLFFDRGLLALSNIFFCAGVVILLGWQSTRQLFFNKANYKGSTCLLLGLLLIVFRWPLIGFVLEIYGASVLFRRFLPLLTNIVRDVPFVGPLLIYPFQILAQLWGTTS